MKHNLETFKKSSSIRKILTLVTGTSVAQLLPLLTAPLLTRLYSPEEFGLLALVVSISSILGSLASLKYELAIVLPDNEKNGISLTVVTLLIAFISSLLIFFVLFFFGDNFTALLGNSELSDWLLFIPLIVFMLSGYETLKYYAIRKNNYSLISKTSIYKSVLLSLTQVGIGLTSVVGGGLIVGYAVSQIGANFSFVKHLVNDKLSHNIDAFNYRNKILMSRYINFPKYTLPAVTANNLALHLNSFFISSAFSSNTLGQYSLVFRSLSLPISLFGSAVGDVFYKKADEDKKKVGNAKSVFDKSLIALSLVALAIFVPAYFLIEDLFVFVFGQEWETSGNIAKIVIPLIAIRLIVAPLSKACSVFEKQSIALIWQVFLLLINLCVCVYSYFNGKDLHFFLNSYVFFTTLHYIIFLLILRRIVSGKL